MPIHSHNLIARNVAWMHLEMGLGNSVGHSSLHDVRKKLEEWEIVVGQPQHRPTVLGRTQVLIVVHGPMVQRANMYAE